MYEKKSEGIYLTGCVHIVTVSYMRKEGEVIIHFRVKFSLTYFI